MARIAATACVLLLTGFSGCVSIKEDMPDPSLRTFNAAGEYLTGPGDILLIRPSDTREEAIEIAVSPNGTIDLPLIDHVDVAGKSIRQLGIHLSELYKPFYNKATFSVSVRAVQSVRCYVSGEVRSPGELTVFPGASVLGVLSKAGGLSDFASGRITLIRRMASGVKSYEFAFEKLLEVESTERVIYAERDDIIVVH